MVKIQSEKLVIEIEHSSPESLVSELQFALMNVLQERELNSLTDLEEYRNTTYTLLELLKGLTVK